MPGNIAAERAEAREWAISYLCPHCGATAEIGHKYVSVRHSRLCPRWRNPRKKKAA